MTINLGCALLGACLIVLVMHPGPVLSKNVFTIGRFETIYEPSGIVQLKNGKIVVIEDDFNDPLRIVEIEQRGDDLILVEKGTLQLKNGYDDLEGVSRGRADDIFLVTSYSLTKQNSRIKEREKLIRLHLDDLIYQEESFDNLYQEIRAVLRQLSFSERTISLNIEGLTFNRKKDQLIFGLRTPLHDGASILLVLQNPYGIFLGSGENVKLDVLAELSIDGGVRALFYYEETGGYLIANEVENKKDKKRSAVWFWCEDTKEPIRIKIPGLKKVKNIEGITIATYSHQKYLLLVCDDGNKKNKGGHYLIVPVDSVFQL